MTKVVKKTTNILIIWFVSETVWLNRSPEVEWVINPRVHLSFSLFEQCLWHRDMAVILCYYHYYTPTLHEISCLQFVSFKWAYKHIGQMLKFGLESKSVHVHVRLTSTFEGSVFDLQWKSNIYLIYVMYCVTLVFRIYYHTGGKMLLDDVYVSIIV